MAPQWGRDRRGRLYWYDPATGRRTRPPAATDRPRAYRVDKRGRGYWTWLDTGRRAPKPAWDGAPRYDRAGRPRDSTGRLVPRASLQHPPALWEPPSRPKAPKKGPKVRPRAPRRVRFQLRGPGDVIPGFAAPGGKLYFTRPTEARPKDLARIFHAWLRGAVRKSPMASSSEIGFRQHGMVFRVTAPLDQTALADLTDRLVGQPVRLVFRSMGANEWEIWAHANLPARGTRAVEQKGYRSVAQAFSGLERASTIMWDFLDEWDADIYWHEYYETEDILYEGGD